MSGRTIGLCPGMSESVGDIVFMVKVLWAHRVPHCLLMSQTTCPKVSI
jgi:hypothetical protein